MHSVTKVIDNSYLNFGRNDYFFQNIIYSYVQAVDCPENGFLLVVNVKKK